MCYSGDIKKGEKAMAELRSCGKPIADVVGPTSFAGWQQAFDPLLTPGARNYWKSHDFIKLSDEAIDTCGLRFRNCQDPKCADLHCACWLRWGEWRGTPLHFLSVTHIS